MALEVGTRLGAYEITGTLGAGGMGEVYRATDTRLGREVAIKTLPAALAQDHGRLARFEREAKLLAALNHAHIAAIYGLDEHEGAQYLAMELVEGETLEEKLKKGRLPIEDALHLALQIAEALEAAHEKGVVHRDLKPANIMVAGDGQVKVLDFGLAKAFSGDPNQATPAHSPALSVAMTQQGLILGTAGYMSPEQASGQATDQRADIWAFGVVLYEMLTGLPLFGGESVPHILAAVLKTEPDWNHLPKNLHPRLKLLLDHCLVKKPRGRLHSIADARIEIENVLNDPQAPYPDALNAQHGRRPARSMIVWTAAVAVIVLVGVAIGLEWARGRPAPAPTPIRMSITAPGQVTPQTSVAVSPDGRELAFVSTDASGQSRLWVRDLASLTPRALAGTEDAAHPFWAPDGSAIGFIARGQLKRVDAAGGQVLTLAEKANRDGGAWSPAGVILFAPRTGELATVPATGGPVSAVLKVPEPVFWPSFLPDGRHFVFFRAGADDVRGVYVGSLGSDTTKLVMHGDFQAVFAPPDYLLFARDEGVVFSQHFDLERLELTGEPTVVAEGVWSYRGAARVSVSAGGGVLAYINTSLTNAGLDWFDRSGRPLGTVGEPGPYEGRGPRIAPDGAHMAIARVPGGGEIWVTRLADGTARRLTLEPGALWPIWSSDSHRILFQWGEGPNITVSVRNTDGNGAAEQFGALTRGILWDWSPDGQRIVFGKLVEQAWNLWILSAGTGGDETPFAPSRFSETQASISPDGQWIAYTSYESGRDEVYVDSFPIAGNRRQISVAGGVQPRWRRDGSELFYLAPDQLLMAVPVNTSQGRFDVGRPAPLFRTRIVPQGSQVVFFHAMYDVSPDGQRFLLNETPADSGPPLTVVLDWAAGSTRPK